MESNEADKTEKLKPHSYHQGIPVKTNLLYYINGNVTSNPSIECAQANQLHTSCETAFWQDKM